MPAGSFANASSGLHESHAHVPVMNSPARATYAEHDDALRITMCSSHQATCFVIGARSAHIHSVPSSSAAGRTPTISAFSRNVKILPHCVQT